MLTQQRSGATIVRREEARCAVAVPPPLVFEYIDRPERLSAHMSRRFWRLGGTFMSIETDAAAGRAVGSRFRLCGNVFGISLDVECVVVDRVVPGLKEWQTIGTPRLLVIGPYRMALRIQPQNGESVVTISLEWWLASGWWSRLLGWLFGGVYARWCVQQMAHDIEAHFASRERQCR